MYDMLHTIFTLVLLMWLKSIQADMSSCTLLLKIMVLLATGASIVILNNSTADKLTISYPKSFFCAHISLDIPLNIFVVYIFSNFFCRRVLGSLVNH